MPGHKSADSAFFGYKHHLAMTEKGIITAVVVTTGEAPDGPQLASHVEKRHQTWRRVRPHRRRRDLFKPRHFDLCCFARVQARRAIEPASLSASSEPGDERTSERTRWKLTFSSSSYVNSARCAKVLQERSHIKILQRVYKVVGT